jgi:hypothetical protein
MERLVGVDTTGAVQAGVARTGVCLSVSITGVAVYWARDHTRRTAWDDRRGSVDVRGLGAQRIRRMCTLCTSPNIAKYTINPEPP